MNSQEVLTSLRTGSPALRRDFLGGLPPNSFKDAALPLVTSDDADSVVLGMASLVMEYCNGASAAVGAPLAEATHELAREVFERGGSTLLPITLSNLAFQHVKALNLLGRSQEALVQAQRYIERYRALGELQNLASLQLAEVEALLNLNRVDEAEERVEDPSLTPDWSNRMERERLRKRIQDLKGTVFQTGKGAPAPDAAAGGQDLVGILKEALAGLTGGQAQDPVRALVDRLDPGHPLDPDDPEGHRRLREILDRGEAHLTKGGGEDNELAVRRTIRGATAIFMQHAPPTPPQLRASLEALEGSLVLARQMGLREHANDALWGIYLCRSRLEDYGGAGDALVELRHSLEATRRGIQDPVRRGGVFAPYPHLFPASVEMLFRAGRPLDMLEAIEASKGRAAADILTRKSGGPVPDADVYAAARAVPELTRRGGFHYLSFFQDEGTVHAVLVMRDGEVRALEPVQLGKEEIRAGMLHVDPGDWGKPDEIDPSTPTPDLGRTLAPLVEELEHLMDRGAISEGDHICYSPDDALSNLPLHYLEFRGARLMDALSVSRIHGAFQLERLWNRTVVRPARYLYVSAPARQDVAARDGGAALQGHLMEPLDVLDEAGLAGEVLGGEEATIGAVAGGARPARLIHFSTHGFFPRLQDDRNPFYHSGLVLSDGIGLPDKDAVGRGDPEGLLTPNRIFEMGADLRDCHVSMMACVSGLSREGMGGDALGLDWAFIQAGAESMVSSHWYVGAADAARFFGAFYAYWLREGMSRGAAYRRATLEGMDGRDSTDAARRAAFSLTGDWR